MAELVPKGAWETHIHVFDPENHPYGAKRPYTPKPAHLLEYPVHITGCKNIVVVQASVQGSSPAPLTDILETQQTQFPDYTVRGMVHIDPDNISDAELDDLHKNGVRGVRLNKMTWGHGEQSGATEIINELRTVASRIARLGWVVGIFCPLATWAAMAEDIRQMNPQVKIVADHFGGTFPGDEDTEKFRSFLQLIRDKKISVKISGFERLYHGHEKGMAAIEPIAKAIFEAGPDQVVFGTDWPHTGLGVSRMGKTDEQRLNDIEGFRDVPDAEHIRTLRRWIEDDELWEKLFVTNPKQLFQ